MDLTTFDVRGQVDLLGQLRDVNFEAVLNLVERLCVGFVRDERDCQTLKDKTRWSQVQKVKVGGEEYLGSEATGSGHAMQVRVGVLGHVVVEHNVHSLDVHAAAEQVRRHKDSLKQSKQGLLHIVSEFHFSRLLCTLTS